VLNLKGIALGSLLLLLSGGCGKAEVIFVEFRELYDGGFSLLDKISSIDLKTGNNKVPQSKFQGKRIIFEGYLNECAFDKDTLQQIYGPLDGGYGGMKYIDALRADSEATFLLNGLNYQVDASVRTLIDFDLMLYEEAMNKCAISGVSFFDRLRFSFEGIATHANHENGKLSINLIDVTKINFIGKEGFWKNLLKTMKEQAACGIWFCFLK
jgi:hypothetical protein